MADNQEIAQPEQLASASEIESMVERKKRAHDDLEESSSSFTIDPSNRPKFPPLKAGKLKVRHLHSNL